MTVSVLGLFFTVPWFGLQCVIVAFLGHTHSLVVLSKAEMECWEDSSCTLHFPQKVIIQCSKLSRHSYICYGKCSKILNTSCLPNWSRQTVQTQIRLLLEKQSDQGLLCLLLCILYFNS